jgi:phospholipid/cholesterol/gamma-HCH transport system permease protein
MPGWRSTDRTGSGPSVANLTVGQDGGQLALRFSGRLNAAGAGKLWHAAIRAATGARGQRLRCDLAGVEAFDMAGAALLLAVEQAHGAPIELTGANAHVAALLALARRAGAEAAASGVASPGASPGAPPGASPGASPGAVPAESRGTTEGQPRRWADGRDADAQGAPQVPTRRPTPGHTQPHVAGLPIPVLAASLNIMANGVVFLGEAVVAVLRLPTHRRMLRPGDVLRYADDAGVRALPLVMLLGFLMGMILAFQSAIPMRRFGADLFVANLVTISLLRELGPLLSAVILAGRTGSAFAAEIGTMKVNEEVDALVTMGIDPMTMLVLPRLIAVMLVLPALALALDIAGLLGMTVVMCSLGFPVVSILHQVQVAAGIGDLLGGLFKAICFGAAVAAIGCQAGLSTGNGPRAVGLSTTAAVVGGIVSTIALDGVLALLFYRLNL